MKLEKYNPGGSMKDRMALNMIEAAERKGCWWCDEHQFQGSCFVAKGTPGTKENQ